MGQQNCCLQADQNQLQYSSARAYPLVADENHVIKNYMPLMKSYSSICQQLLKCLELIRYNQILFRIQNPSESSSSSNDQNKINNKKGGEYPTSIAINDENQYNSLVDYDTLNGDLKGQLLLEKDRIKYQSTESAREEMISELIKMLSNMINQNKLLMLKKNLSSRNVCNKIKIMETFLLKFLDLKKYFIPDGNKKSIVWSELKGFEEIGFNYSQLLSEQEKNDLLSICQRIQDILPENNGLYLSNRKDYTFVDGKGYSIDENNNEKSFEQNNYLHQKNPTLFNSTQQSVIANLSLQFLTKFPFQPNDIISINRKKKEILIKNCSGELDQMTIVFQRAKDEKRLKEMHLQLQLSHSLSLEQESPVTLKIQGPFQVLENVICFQIV